MSKPGVYAHLPLEQGAFECNGDLPSINQQLRGFGVPDVFLPDHFNDRVPMDERHEPKQDLTGPARYNRQEREVPPAATKWAHHESLVRSEEHTPELQP